VSRAEVWKRLGPPNDQIGSVNDPRIREDFGHKWNEKWIYLTEDGKAVDKIVLWLRYDLVGAFTADGAQLKLED
jgi:hypothetical protein